MDQFRTGRISSINYSEGTATVTYEDRDDAVTDEMPLLAFGFIYWMPKPGDPVMVLHMPNGGAAGVILGRYWCAENMPPEAGNGLYRHDMDRAGQCYMKHLEGDVWKLYSPNGVEIVGDTTVKGTLTVEKSTTLQSGLNCYGTHANGTSGMSVQGTGNFSGEVTSGNIGLQAHHHTCPDGDTSPSKP